MEEKKAESLMNTNGGVSTAMSIIILFRILYIVSIKLTRKTALNILNILVILFQKVNF